MHQKHLGQNFGKMVTVVQSSVQMFLSPHIETGQQLESHIRTLQTMFAIRESDEMLPRAPKCSRLRTEQQKPPYLPASGICAELREFLTTKMTRHQPTTFVNIYIYIKLSLYGLSMQTQYNSKTNDRRAGERLEKNILI